MSLGSRSDRLVPFRVLTPRSPPMTATIPTPPASATAPATASAEERHADRERRLDEAAAILAETLLDLWRHEHRERRDAAGRGAS